LTPVGLIKTAVVLPLTITRRVIGFGLGLLPGSGEEERYHAPSGAWRKPEREDPPVRVEPHAAAEEAVEREREPVEELPRIEDDLSGHVEPEVELVAEIADAEAPDSPGPQLHVDEPWEGYRRMKVAEIVARLEGQTPEVLAAVELYESTHRHRAGVLNAVLAASRT
jgi:hypothetical protein